MRPNVVSTVITVYNRPRLLVDAIESVLAQTYRPIEIIVIDDGSTDGSGEVARTFAANHPEIVRYIHQANQGPAAASNAGVRIATGEFIQLLDSDDVLMPEKFAMQVAGLREHPECGISYCYTREYAFGEVWSGQPARRTGETFERLFPALLERRIWPAPSPLYRRSVLDDCGPFLELSLYQDWEFECRAAARGVALHHCRVYLADVRNTHRLEGRKVRRATEATLQQRADVLRRILGHARDGGVSHADLAGFSRSVFAAARKCAADGSDAAARQCLAIAIDAAGWSRVRRALYLSAAGILGSAAVARIGERPERGWLVEVRSFALRRPRAFTARWRHRAHTAAATVTGQPISRWPNLLWNRWSQRRSKVCAHP